MIRLLKECRSDKAERSGSASKPRSLAVPFGFLPPSYAESFSAAAIIHIFYEELSQEILAYANNLPRGTDLYISTVSEQKAERIEQVFERYKFGRCEIKIVPNRGRDIAPKLVAFREVYESYEFVLHLHSKKSAHEHRLDRWRPYLYETLCGSREQIRDVLGLFRHLPNLGMIFAEHYEYTRPYLTWGDSFGPAERLCRRMGHELTPDHPLEFPAGSMFWARTAALRPLLDLGLSEQDFPEEMGQTDGTLAHAIERLYAIACELAGFDWLKIARPELLTKTATILPVSSVQAIDRFIADGLVRLTSGAAFEPIAGEGVVEPTSALATLAAQHEAWSTAAEKFGLWTKAPSLRWGPGRVRNDVAAGGDTLGRVLPTQERKSS